MAASTSIDPRALMHAPVSAWDPGQAAAAAPHPTAPLRPACEPNGAGEVAARLARIEESLLRQEALLSSMREEAERARGKRRKRWRDRG